jgi:hypothetical protein
MEVQLAATIADCLKFMQAILAHFCGLKSDYMSFSFNHIYASVKVFSKRTFRLPYTTYA